jgi:hypothetical protein
VDAAVFEKLCELSQDPWTFQPQAGVHWCDLCRFTGNSMASDQNPRGLSYRVSAASSCGPMVVPGRGASLPRSDECDALHRRSWLPPAGRILPSGSRLSADAVHGLLEGRAQ